MAENSGIQWCHHTYNPWIGCTKVSPACDFCYAEADNNRRKWNRDGWGPHADRHRTKTHNNPIKWNQQAKEQGVRFRVFCASLADVFDNHKSIQPEWRDELWRLIENTPDLDWLLLTKRPQNIARYVPPSWLAWPKVNVWYGTTVENQAEANRRIPELMTIPGAVRFLSCEPLLGPVDLTGVEHKPGQFFDALRRQVNPIDWVITGGESGPNFRPSNLDWFRALRDQCADANVPFLFKQWAGKTPRQIKALGRELDGVVHDDYPQGVEALARYQEADHA